MRISRPAPWGTLHMGAEDQRSIGKDIRRGIVGSSVVGLGEDVNDNTWRKGGEKSEQPSHPEPSSDTRGSSQPSLQCWRTAV